jgi:hypothetical protein
MKSLAGLFFTAALLAGTLVPAGLPAAAAATPASGPGPGSIGLRLLEAPVVRRDDPRAQIYIVDHLMPGTTIRRRVEISNKTPVRRHMKLYPSAAAIRNNRFTFAEGHAANELTDWTSVDRPEQNLAPRSVSQARVTIRIPKTAAPGERYAVLWAESASPPDAKHNVGSITRVGVRIYLDIETGPEFCDFTIDKITATRSSDGRPGVVARVRNTGRRALDLEGKLNLTHGPGAMSAGPYQVTPGTTLPPGGSGVVTVALDSHLPEGPWKATLDLQSGPVKRQVVARLTFPKPGAASEATLLKSSGFGPWPGIVLALVCGALIVGVIQFRRRPAA